MTFVMPFRASDTFVFWWLNTRCMYYSHGWLVFWWLNTRCMYYSHGWLVVPPLSYL